MSQPKLKVKGNEITITLKVVMKDSMLKSEDVIRDALNKAGAALTAKALEKFDTDGSPIIREGEKYTVQGYNSETYQSPYGEFQIKRYVYQNSKGGKTYCPLESNGRIVIKSTPKFARIISFKYGNSGAENVCRDMKETLKLKVNKSLVQRVGEAVGTFLGAKEQEWEYALPKTKEPTSSVSIGMDGTMVLLCEDGYREAMVGTIALYDKAGNRQHTIYTAATPEYGKENFLENFRREIERVQEQLPDVTYIGLADGAKCNWLFLKEYTDNQLIDFYHSTQYLTTASEAMFRKKRDKESWLETACHRLKHNKTGARQLLKKMVHCHENDNISQIKARKLEKSITYFKNNSPKMKYSYHSKNNHPIGSGVTESAAKLLVKQRLCNSGMRWKEKGAASVLHIRTKIMTDNRWDKAWEKVDKYGFSRVAA